jgi:hypothetical protein
VFSLVVLLLLWGMAIHREQDGFFLKKWASTNSEIFKKIGMYAYLTRGMSRCGLAIYI